MCDHGVGDATKPRSYCVVWHSGYEKWASGISCARAFEYFFFREGKSTNQESGPFLSSYIRTFFFLLPLIPSLLNSFFFITSFLIKKTPLSSHYTIPLHSPIMSQRPKATRAETSEMEMPPTTLSKKQFQQVGEGIIGHVALHRAVQLTCEKTLRLEGGSSLELTRFLSSCCTVL